FLYLISSSPSHPRLFPYTTLFRSVGTYCSADPLRISGGKCFWTYVVDPLRSLDPLGLVPHETSRRRALQRAQQHAQVPSAGRKIDRKSTRLNSSHVKIMYAVICLK